MHTKEDNVLPAQGTSDPQGPAGGRGTVPAPPPSSSDDGLPRESRVGSRGARTTTPKWWREISEELPSWTKLNSMEWQEFVFEKDFQNTEKELGTRTKAKLYRHFLALRDLIEKLEKVDHMIRNGDGMMPPKRSVATQIEVDPPLAKKGDKIESGSATSHSQPRGKGAKPSPVENGSGGEKTPPSLKEGDGFLAPLNRGKKSTYSEVVRSPPSGRASASSLGDKSSSEDTRGRGTRSSKVTIRVPNIGDIGLLGLGTGDLIIMVPGIDEAPQQGEKPPFKREAEKGDRPPRARFKRENGGAEVRGGGVGAEDPASPAAARCYRCLIPGHLATNCGGPDRRHRCYRCGDDSCRWRRCRSDLPKCPLCVDLGRSFEHVLGSGACRWWVPGRRKRGRHKGDRDGDEPSPPDKGGETGSSCSGSGS